MAYRVIYIMGVSSCGKTTIGKRLGKALGLPFFDGDDFHPTENIEKMRDGQPLNDDDRAGWLASIHGFVQQHLLTGSLIVACSALKEKYRTTLTADLEGEVSWVVLVGSYSLLLKRALLRKNHFMPASLLQSQLDTLELPSYGQHIDIALGKKKIVENIVENTPI